MHFMHSDLE